MGRLIDLFRRRQFSALEYAAHALDRAADFGDRQEFVDALGTFDEAEAEAALIQIASDSSEDEELVDSAGNSLWEIWNRQGRPAPPEVVSKLCPAARKFFSG